MAPMHGPLRVSNMLDDEDIYSLFDSAMGGTGAVERIEYGDMKIVHIVQGNETLEDIDSFYNGLENGTYEYFKCLFPWDNEPSWSRDPHISRRHIMEDNIVYEIRLHYENN